MDGLFSLFFYYVRSDKHFLEGVSTSTQSLPFSFVKVVIDMQPPSSFNAALCIICQQDEDRENLVKV